MHIDSMLRSPSADESLVPVTFLSSEVEVAMSDRKADRFFQPGEKLRHAHGIHSSAYSQKDRRG